MPSKLFQKRKEQAARRAARAQEERADQIRVLVVSEGSKTEPNYISEFIRLEGLGRVEPHLTRDHNTAPTTLLSQARQLLKRDPDFDLAFILSDRDEFQDFDAVRNACEQIKSIPKIKYIYSDPCFEVWLIFHYEKCDKPLTRHEAVKHLQKYIDGYAKGDVGVAQIVYARTDEAIANSKTSLARCEQTNTTCPSTLMHEVVEALRQKAKR